MYLGRWSINDYVTFCVNTHDPTNSGAASDADSVPTYRVYEDETATPIATGSMALLDAGNTVGFYSERIQLTAASGFEAGKSYTIYITATVSSIVGTTQHTLQIGNVDANVADMDAAIATEIADEILKRDWTSVSGEAARSMLNALRSLRNRVYISGSTFIVCEEDDSTVAYSGPVTTTPGADPVTGFDPST